MDLRERPRRPLNSDVGRLSMSVGTFSILHDAGSIEYSDSTLLVGIDETGHEEFADNRHPVFGLGGCAVLLRNYEEHIANPWRQMKEQFFGGAARPLHASDLRTPSPDQLDALNYFFTTQPFFRFAAMSARTVVNTTEAPVIQLLGHAIWGCIAEISKWAQPLDVVVVLEDSERLRRDLYGYIAGFEIGNEDVHIKPRVFFATKRVNQPFMEVADFVIQAAGAQVRNRVLGKLNPMRVIRKDFESIFHSVDRRLTSYTELLEAHPGEVPNPSLQRTASGGR